MNRRSFIRVIASCPAIESALAEESLARGQAFKITESADEILTECAASTHLFAITRRTSQYMLVCANSRGEVVWKHALAGDRSVRQINVTPSGGVAMIRVGYGTSQVAEFDVSGRVVGSVPLNEVPLASCLAGGKFVGFFRAGSVGIRDLRKQDQSFEQIASGLTSGQIGTFIPPIPVVALHSLSDNRVVIVDMPSARLITLDLIRKASTAAAIAAPEISASLSMYAKEIENMRRTRSDIGPASLAIPNIIHASATNFAGRLYCMPSPINAREPLVLAVDDKGVVPRRFRCKVPERAAGPAKIPFTMAILGGQLCLAFHDGDVLLYEI